MFYRTFYRLPHPVRRKLVRLVVPKYIVGAVTLLYDEDAPPPGRLLLLRQPPGDKGWGLPAGLLQRHEEPVVGAARELHEESGVLLAPEQLRPAAPNAVIHLKGWVDCVFEASVPAATTPLVVDGGEVYEAAWHPLDNLPRLTTSTARLLGRYGIGPLADTFVGSPATPASATPGDAAAHGSTPPAPGAPAADEPGADEPGRTDPGPAA